MSAHQDKAKEVSFFDQCAASQDYNVFSSRSRRRLIAACLALAKLSPPGRLADLGCGSGVFSALLRDEGFAVVGLDISHGLTVLGRNLRPQVSFVTSDVEALPFRSGSLDGVLLSGVLHHLPDPRLCAREVHRVLKTGGRFMAFDPNRQNPFMYLYRDPSSLLYSSEGVTENERPILADDLKEMFAAAGFQVHISYLSLSFRWVSSTLARFFLPAFNVVESLLFSLPPLQRFRGFVLTAGIKEEK